MTLKRQRFPSGQSHSIEWHTTTTGSNGIGNWVPLASIPAEHKTSPDPDDSLLLLLRLPLQLPQSSTTLIFQYRVAIRNEKRFPSNGMDGIVNQSMAPERGGGTRSVGQGGSTRQADLTQRGANVGRGCGHQHRRSVNFGHFRDLRSMSMKPMVDGGEQHIRQSTCSGSGRRHYARGLPLRGHS